MKKRKVNFGIIGAGGIARRKTILVAKIPRARAGRKIVSLTDG